MRFLRDQQRLQQFLGGDHHAPFTLRSPCDPPAISLTTHSIMRFFAVWKRLWQDESMQAMFVRGTDPSIAIISDWRVFCPVCLRSVHFYLVYVDSLRAVYAERANCCCSTVIVPVMPHLPAAVLDEPHSSDFVVIVCVVVVEPLLYK